MSDLPTGLLCIPNHADLTLVRLQKKVRLVALRTLLGATGEGLGARGVGSLTQLKTVVQSMVRRDQVAVLQALGAPDVLGPLLVLSRGLRPQAEILAAVVPDLMAALSQHCSSLPEAVLWEVEVRSVHHPAEGWSITLSPPGRSLLLNPSGLTIEQHDGRRTRLVGRESDSVTIDRPYLGLGRPSHGVQLCTQDTNPLSLEEAHPDKSGNAVALGEHPIGAWKESLDGALELIEQALPEWAAEIPVALSRVVPVGSDEQMHLSASYREAPELVYMTLHPDPLTMAEAIVHEVQHSKCNLLSWMDPVLHNGYTTWTDSPVRPDLRPLMGVLMAVHAFVPVAALHHRLAVLDHPLSRTRRFLERRVEVLSGNRGGLRVLQERAEPTAAGTRLLDALGELHTFLVAQAPEIPDAPAAMPPG
jgi:HEXXH motif-containing protein